MGLRSKIAAMVGAAAFVSVTGAAPPVTAAGFVGAYIWGGTLDGASSGLERFAASAGMVLDAGFDTVRFTIGPNVVSDYALSPDPCAGHPSLGCYAGAMLADKVWDRPELKRIVVSTIDFSCFAEQNGNGCLVAARLDANAAAIRAEYADLLGVLAARFGERSVAFILTNWEGDNFAYCGDSYRFASNLAGFAATCKATWPKGQTNAERVAAFVRWTDLKAEAAAAFATTHPGVDVVIAPEFNTFAVFAAQCPVSGVCDAGTDTVLDAIAAAGGRPACSWSSYDSEGPPGGAYLAAARAILKTCKHLMIGEGGYDLLRYSSDQARSLFAAMDEIRREPDVLGVVPWHAFDARDAATRYGFWTSDGAPQAIQFLGPLRPVPGHQAAPGP